MTEQFEELKKIIKNNPVSGADLSPMQRIIIPMVQAGYTLRIRSRIYLTYGKDDHRVSVFADGTILEFNAPAERYF